MHWLQRATGNGSCSTLCDSNIHPEIERQRLKLRQHMDRFNPAVPQEWCASDICEVKTKITCPSHRCILCERAIHAFWGSAVSAELRMKFAPDAPEKGSVPKRLCQDCKKKDPAQSKCRQISSLQASSADSKMSSSRPPLSLLTEGPTAMR
jgi:hypothetical protein